MFPEPNPSHKSARAVATPLCAVLDVRLQTCRCPTGAWLQAHFLMITSQQGRRWPIRKVTVLSFAIAIAKRVCSPAARRCREGLLSMSLSRNGRVDGLDA